MPTVTVSQTHRRSFPLDLSGSDGLTDHRDLIFTMTDSVTKSTNPYWREQIRRRQNATTVLTGVKVKVQHKPGSYRLVNPSWGAGWWSKMDGTILGLTSDVLPLTFPTSLSGSVNNLAVSRFVEAAVNAQRSFQGSTFMGELLETLRMVKNPAAALRKGISDYAKAARKRAKRYPGRTRKQKQRQSKALSGLWLEYMFGWSPLVSDIQSGIEALTRYDPNPTIDVRAGAKEKSTANTTMTRSYGNTFSNIVAADEYRASCRYVGEVWATPPYLKGMPAASTFGFDPIRDFIPTVHELIPYSFLFDYFSNLGIVVQAWCFWRSNLAWYCRTREELAMRRLVFGPYYRTSAAFSFTINSPETWTSWRRNVYRDVPTTLIPEFTFELPGSDLKWLNIAALLNERR